MYIKIGQIINTHGNKGELKIYPLTDGLSRFEELGHVFIHHQGVYREYQVKGVRFYKELVLMTLDEVPDMNAAEKLKTLYLELPETELKDLPAGHYYIYQLVGLNVYEQERFLGKITDVVKTGSNDVYMLEGTERKKALLIPALKEVVKEIDLAAGRMEVVLPEGLED
ncbi:MAG: ribosome maturation factor RimM [Clostridia bacterium]|jgi:16S rRNA processing protein RimM|nr:ribosome maturation factor RimM [Clostridia bacterium]